MLSAQVLPPVRVSRRGGGREYLSLYVSVPGGHLLLYLRRLRHPELLDGQVPHSPRPYGLPD